MRAQERTTRPQSIGLHLLLLVVLSLPVSALDNTNVGRVWGTTFSGTIGKSQVSMRLWLSSPRLLEEETYSLLNNPTGVRLEGFYFYDRFKQDILLTGQSDQKGNWTLSEYAEPGKPATGVFRGLLSGNKFRGQWESPDKQRVLEFDLTATARDIRTAQESRTISRRYEELAADSAEAKDFPTAILYLKLSRFAGNASFITQNWESLFAALMQGRREELKKKLTSCKKETNYACGFAVGPLAYLAAQDGDFEHAKSLYRHLCRHRDPSLSPPPAFECLMYAALGAHIRDRKSELEGYDLACQRTGLACGKAWGPDELQLISAIRERKSEVAKTLLQKDVNVNAQDGAALLNAVVGGDRELVEMLVHKGADPNLSDGSILDTAIMNHHIEIADFLLDHGADPTTPDVSGRSQALYSAVASGNIHLIEKLLAKGADVNDNDYVGGGTPLLRAAQDNQAEIVRLLLDHGADPEISAKFLGSPMEVTSSPEVKKLLTEAIASCKAGTRKCESR